MQIEERKGPTSLPIELLEQVIGIIQDPVSLKACSRVSQTFAALAQKHIFHEILFTPQSSLNVTGETFRRFFDLLQESPHIAHYVQEIVIDATFLAASTRNQCLQRTLPLLKELRKIGLSKKHVSVDSFWWYFMDVETRDALLDVFRSPLITDIDLTGIRDFPPEECFVFTPSLKNLSLPTLVFDRSSIDPLAYLLNPQSSSSSPCFATSTPPTCSTLVASRPKLESLTIIDVLDNGLTLPWLASPASISPVDLAELETLRLDFEEVTSTNNQDSSKLDMAMSLFSRTLTRFRLNVLQRNMAYFLWSETQGWSSLPRSSIHPPNLSILSMLDCMIIDSKIFQHPIGSDRPLSYRSPLPWIAWLLDGSADLELKKLILNISFRGIARTILLNLDWRRLTEALSARMKWKGTTVELHFRNIESTGVEALDSNESFAELASRGVTILYRS
ncbi:hypothetical protein NLJ89_g4103 [Agrocybe chaxingu]|uniref:F-box domain-containing protein n=1 Tax=Agrocybe chaxingu TaxID=84603 RepID=A0A9W8MXZ0_9AGAR|nr:hypothetical protein NLJ89_g4103 [Agrocybe chaxingu]